LSHDRLFFLVLSKDKDYPPHEALFKIPKKLELAKNKSIQQKKNIVDWQN